PTPAVPAMADITTGPGAVPAGPSRLVSAFSSRARPVKPGTAGGSCRTAGAVSAAGAVPFPPNGRRAASSKAIELRRSLRVVPRSISLIARTLKPESSVSCSWVSPARTRRTRTIPWGPPGSSRFTPGFWQPLRARGKRQQPRFWRSAAGGNVSYLVGAECESVPRPTCQDRAPGSGPVRPGNRPLSLVELNEAAITLLTQPELGPVVVAAQEPSR